MPSVESAVTSKAAPVNTRKQQAEEARARIIAAALKLFASRGYEGASMPQIAKLSNASVPLLVYHFKNKESLWRATIEKAVEQFDAKLKALIDQQNSATETLRKMIAALVQASTQYPEFHRLMLLESHEDTPRLDWLCIQFAKSHNEMMLKIITKAQHEGGVCGADPQRLLHAIVGMATISTQAAEFKKISEIDLFSKAEIEKTIETIEYLVFVR